MRYHAVDAATPSFLTRSGVFHTPSPRPPSTDNPLLGMLQRASEHMEHLRSQADEWIAQARSRSVVTREAHLSMGAIDEALARLRATGTPEPLPDGLREFAARHGLLSSSQRTGVFDAASLTHLRASVRTLASASGESSTVEQIELKQFLSRYDNALTLSNAVIVKLRDITSRIISGL